MLTNVLSYGLGTLIAIALVFGLAFLFISDITQKKHGVLRNYPVIRHLRYFFEQLGGYFRQYFFSGDREESPFNRATRARVYRMAKNEGSIIGFGSTYDMHQPGALIFVNHPFPVLEEERLPMPSLALGEGYCTHPFEARSVVNVSGMSFGAISALAVRALSRGAAAAGCWIDTGEGSLSPYHLEGGADIIMQIGTAKYGMRDAQGSLSKERLAEIAKVAKAVELKLSQGAKPGKGGVLPGGQVTAEIAQIRGIPEGRDSISPKRHRDIANVDQLLEKIAMLRDITGRPVGVKTAIGGWGLIKVLTDAIQRRGLEFATDFLVIDGGSGAAPQALADNMSLSIDEALPRVVDGPTGVSTHNPRLRRALMVEEKYLRVANYCNNMNRVIAHSCGARDARELKREHVRIARASGQPVALSVLSPCYGPTARVKAA
jgi:glutamate synthase domain-containing protein 2